MTLKARKITNRNRCPDETCHRERRRSKTPKMTEKMSCLPPIVNKENVEVPTNTPVKHMDEFHLPNIRERTNHLFNSVVPQEDNLPDKINKVFFLPSVNGQGQRNTTSTVTPSFRKQQPLQLASHVKRLDEKDKFSNFF